MFRQTSRSPSDRQQPNPMAVRIHCDKGTRLKVRSRHLNRPNHNLPDSGREDNLNHAGTSRLLGCKEHPDVTPDEGCVNRNDESIRLNNE
jgi:hypothetical protein